MVPHLLQLCLSVLGRKVSSEGRGGEQEDEEDGQLLPRLHGVSLKSNNSEVKDHLVKTQPLNVQRPLLVVWIDD